jgi:hypothetical protein
LIVAVFPAVGVSFNNAVIISAAVGTASIAGNTATIKDVLLSVYAMTRGRIVKTGNRFDFYDDNNTTILFSINVTSEQRTPQ